MNEQAKPISRRRQITLLLCSALCIALIGLILWAKARFIGDGQIQYGAKIDTPSALSTWPWPTVKQDAPHQGITHWFAKAPDGTTLDLLKFDFAANPKLRFEIYDQDEDDAKPFDDVVNYEAMGVGQAVAHITKINHGKVMAAWNGIFFGFNTIPKRTAYHVSPVVLHGKAHYYNVATNHRWMYGVKQTETGPQFKIFFKPDQQKAEHEFDFAVASAQCLIRDGKPLKLQPFPKPGEAPMKQPVPSTEQEAGHIPILDHMKTTRASQAWSRDSKQLYLLFVKEPDSETASAFAMLHRTPLGGGWTVPDLQRFWLSMGVANAINSDAGDVGQMSYLRSDGNYDLLPPRWSSNAMRLTCGPDFKTAPQGGSLTYYFVREID